MASTRVTAALQRGGAHLLLRPAAPPQQLGSLFRGFMGSSSAGCVSAGAARGTPAAGAPPFLPPQGWWAPRRCCVHTAAGPAPLVGSQAPDFEADAFMPSGCIEKVSLKQLLGKHAGVCLVFYPLNFTYVCPTELLAFNKQHDEFVKRNWALLGVSVDSAYSHGMYTRLEPSQGGVGPLSFPLVSDLSKSISSAYGLLVNNSVALRGAMLIDAEGVLRHSTVNDLSLGRSVEETLRVIDMIDFVRQNGGQVCPANWAKGRRAMAASDEGVKQYLTEEHGSKA